MNRVVPPVRPCLPIALCRCPGRSSGRLRPHVVLRTGRPGAGLLHDLLVRRRDAGGPGPAGRPAWQSPYGPPPHRSHRGRWVPAPGLTVSRTDLQRGHPSGQRD